jgi:hypothetical protein
MLELVRAHDPAVAIEIHQGAAPRLAAIDAAADLLLQNLTTLMSAEVAATLVARGPAALSRRITVHRSDLHET